MLPEELVESFPQLENIISLCLNDNADTFGPADGDLKQNTLPEKHKSGIQRPAGQFEFGKAYLARLRSNPTLGL